MNITIDRIVDTFISGNLPIPGALFCEYTLGNKFTPDLIAQSYDNPDRFHVDQRALVTVEGAGPLFWILLRKYAAPTKYEVGVWAKCLLRHIYACSASAVNDTGPVPGTTKLPIDIFDNAETIMDALEGVGDIKGREVDRDQDGPTIAKYLSDIDRRRGETYKPFIQYLASWFHLPDNGGEQHVDLNNYKLGSAGSDKKRVPNLLKMMYSWLVQTHRQLEEWNQTGWSAKNFERSEKYRNAYWDVIPKGEQEPPNLWIENLSTLVATTPYTENFRQVTINPRIFHNLYNINPTEHSRAAYEICQNVLFYSDAGQAKGRIISMINGFMDRLTTTGEAPNFSYAHRHFELDKYEFSPKETMESGNYKQIRDLIGEHDPRETYESEVLGESDVLVADIVTGEVEGENIDPDVSKATVAKVLQNVGDVEKEKPVVKKTKLDIIAEQDDETSTITYLVIAGAIFAFAFR